jgi:hypothetical protein
MTYKLKVFSLFFSFVLFLFLNSNTVFAQEETATESSEVPLLTSVYADYTKIIDEYTKLHDDFIVKRAQYLRFKTLKSQEEAQASTLSMLQKRDDVVVSYLKVLQSRIEEAVGVTDSRRDALNFRINGEIQWFTEHREILTSAASLSDLVKDSTKAELRFDSVISLAYEVLANTSYGHIVDFQERVKDLQGNLKMKVENIKSEERDEYKLSSDKLQVIDRWIFESDNRIVRGEERQGGAEISITDLNRYTGTAVLGSYNQTLTKLGESQLYYKEASSFMREVIREIKVQDL